MTTHAAQSRASLRHGLLLALLAFGIYAGSIPSGFVFDDRGAIETNPVVNGTGPASEVWTRDFWGTRPPVMGMFRPLITLWFRVDWIVSGGRPLWFHLVNVLLHTVVVVVAWLVGRRIIGERAALWGAAFLAVFAAPAEAVQGLVGRADLALALFALLGLAAHRSSRTAGVWLAAVCFALALLSKESAVVVPAVWLLFDWWRPTTRSFRQQLARLLLTVPPLIGYVLLRRHAFGDALRPKADPLLSPLGVADPVGRLFGAGRVFLEQYVRSIVDPFARRYLCTEPECHPAAPDDIGAWLGLLLAIAFVVATLVLARRRHVIALGLAWFALFFLPVSNFIVGSTTSYAERLLYAPVVGLGWALGAGVDWAQRRAKHQGVSRVILVLLLVLNAVAIQRRHFEWRSDTTLFLSAVDEYPQDAVIQVNAAHALFDQGRMEAAAAHAQKALELWPASVPAAALLGGSLDALNRPNEANAVFMKALIGPGRHDASLMTEYARFLAHRGQLEQAQVWAKRATDRAPTNADAKEIQSRIERALKERGGR